MKKIIFLSAIILLLLSSGFSDAYNLSSSNWNNAFSDDFNRANSNTVDSAYYVEKENSVTDCKIYSNTLQLESTGGIHGNVALNFSKIVDYVADDFEMIRIEYDFKQTELTNCRMGFQSAVAWNVAGYVGTKLAGTKIYWETPTKFGYLYQDSSITGDLVTITSGQEINVDLIMNTSNNNLSWYVDDVYIRSAVVGLGGTPQELYSFTVSDKTGVHYNVDNLNFYYYEPIIINITNFNATTIYDNSTNHFLKYNTATNVLFTSTNSSGDYVENLININCDFGINENVTAGTNYELTINNSLNNSCLISNAYNNDVNLTSYFYSTASGSTIYDNSTNHFVKLNDSLLLNFSTQFEGVNVPSYLGVNITSLNNNQTTFSGESLNITFNSSQYYLHNILVYDILNPSNQETFIFASLNVYNLTTDYLTNILVGNNNIIGFDYENETQIDDFNITNFIYYNGTKYSGKTTNVGVVPDITGTNENISMNFFINATYNDEILNYNYSYYQMLWKPFMYIKNSAVAGSTFLNISFYDETNRTNRINADATYFFTIFFDDETNISFFNTTTDETNHYVIVEPNVFDYNVKIDVFYTGIETNRTFYDRTYYYFNTSLNNNSQQLFLYSLDNSTYNQRLNLILKQEGTGEKLGGYFIRVKRWFPNTDAYEVVDVVETDEQGTAYALIQYSDVDSAYYEFEILNALGFTVGGGISKNRYFEPIQTLTIEVPDEYIVSSIFDYEIISNIDALRNETTNVLSLTISNTKGNSFESMFNLTRFDEGTRINEVCSSSTVSASTTYLCVVEDITLNNFNVAVAVYQDETFVNVFNEWIDLRVFEIDFGDIGLFLSLILFGSLITFGFIYAGTFGGGLGFILCLFILKVFNLIRINDYIFYTLISLGVLITGLIVMNRK